MVTRDSKTGGMAARTFAAGQTWLQFISTPRFERIGNSRVTSARTDWAAISRDSAALNVYLLGPVEYDSALRLQELLRRDVADRADRRGTLLVCEHPPVVTVGHAGSHADLPVDPLTLTSRLIDVRWVNRPGGTLLHAPGQLAIYPLLPLERLGLPLDGLAKALQQAVLDLCSDLRVQAWADEGSHDVWSRCGKVAFSVPAERDQASCHGLFLNVSPDLTLMRLVQSVRPRNRIGSLLAQRVRPVSMHGVREGLARHLVSRLGYQDYHVFTGHPMLKRSRKKVYDFAGHH